MKNLPSKGIIVDQINQLRMAFNLIQQNKIKKTNIKYYFNLWKKNALKNNYRKINILQKKINLNDTRNIKTSINKKYSERKNIQLNYSNNQIYKSGIQNNIISKFIDNENKMENSSELLKNKNQINNTIIYTKKILKNNQIFNNNNYRYNKNINNVLKFGKG